LRELAWAEVRAHPPYNPSLHVKKTHMHPFPGVLFLALILLAILAIDTAPDAKARCSLTGRCRKAKILLFVF